MATEFCRKFVTDDSHWQIFAEYRKVSCELFVHDSMGYLLVMLKSVLLSDMFHSTFPFSFECGKRGQEDETARQR
jgi:hypothetical protein